MQKNNWCFAGSRPSVQNDADRYFLLLEPSEIENNIVDEITDESRGSIIDMRKIPIKGLGGHVYPEVE